MAKQSLRSVIVFRNRNGDSHYEFRGIHCKSEGATHLINQKTMDQKKIDFKISEKIANIVKAEVGKCYNNVANAFLDKEARSLLPDQIFYVEGIWMTGGQPNLHAWIESGETIFDPTLVISDKHVLCDAHQYRVHFPVEQVDEEQFLDRLTKENYKIGSCRSLKINRNDPEVELVRKLIDPP